MKVETNDFKMLLTWYQIKIFNKVLVILMDTNQKVRISTFKMKLSSDDDACWSIKKETKQCKCQNFEKCKMKVLPDVDTSSMRRSLRTTDFLSV